MNHGWFWILLLVCAGGIGCSQKSSDLAMEDDLDFTELDGTRKTAATSREPVPQAQALPQERFELKLKVGDRFPLVKTVDQRVLQGANATAVSATSLLELIMAISVEEMQGPRKRFRVTYDRVKFTQTIGGQKVEYDSEQLRPQVPTEALAYAGLARNGFSFWLGADNELTEIIGFDDFLKRCLRDVPREQQPDAFVKVASLRNEDGIANFIDHSMGLLPTQRDANGVISAVHVGSRWQVKPRRVEGPIPMTLSTECVLKELTDREAVIDVVGSISPAMAQYGVHGVKAELKGGNCVGHCAVDRQTGLPIRTRLEQYLEMIVELPDGTRIPQKKQVVTTVQTFPDQQPLLGRGGSGNRAIQPVSNQESTGQSRDRVKQAIHEEPQPDWAK